MSSHPSVTKRFISHLQDTTGSTSVRILSALVLLPIVMLLIWLPGLHMGFVLLVTLMALAGLYEYFRIVRACNLPAEALAAIFSGTLLVAATGFLHGPALTGIFTVLLLLLTTVQLLRQPQSLAGMAALVFGLFYAAWLPTYFIRLHAFTQIGPGLVTLLLIAIAASDTAAYFTGRAIGKHKLAPRISPKKTWEGSIGGILGAMICMGVLWALRHNFQWYSYPDWPLAIYLLLGAVLAIVGQIGDLVESQLKRDAGLKDSGALIPGHGGILDRCDGFLFAGPILYYITTLPGL